MTKQLFLNELAAALHSLPREERYRTLGYYDELIDDRMEDGQSEEDAVASLGEPQQVAREILGEEEPAPSTSRGRKVWLIVLLVLGFPLWGSLLLVAAIESAITINLGIPYFSGTVLPNPSLCAATTRAGRALNTRMRSATEIASLMSCVTRIAVFFSLRMMLYTSSHTERRVW